MQIQPEYRAKVSDQYGEFVVEPLARGYGVTLGNPLRRILLSSIPGTAVTSVYIEDVLHEFSTITGVKEDVMQIILNLKELVVKLYNQEPVTLTLRVDKPGKVTAAHFEVPADAKIINPDLHIATLAKGGKLVMEVRVEPGVGYVSSEIHATKDRINSIPVDAVFTPVRRVSYRVEDTRVGQKTDLDRLVLRVWTTAPSGRARRWTRRWSSCVPNLTSLACQAMEQSLRSKKFRSSPSPSRSQHPRSSGRSW